MKAAVQGHQNLQKALIKLIKSEVLPEDNYLAGGTALYFLMHHRLSVDLDFFSPRPFNPELIVFRLKRAFKDVGLELMEKDSLILFLGREKLKFSLFHLPHKLLAPLTEFRIAPRSVVSLASFDDIEAMKALALVQRGSAKDFVDLFYLLKKTGHSFADLSVLVQRKYGVDKKYDYHLKTATVYFDDAEQELSAIMLLTKSGGVRSIRKREWQEIKDFFAGFSR